MPSVIGAACDGDLGALISGAAGDITFIYSHIQSMTTRISSDPMNAPIPAGTAITDHIRRNMDELTISGIFGCSGCGNDESDITSIILRLKQVSNEMVYSPDNFFTITTNHARYSKMILVESEVSASDKSHQYLNITTKWVGANLFGTISTPSFEAGGIFGAGG